MSVPASHLEEALKPEADVEIELFEMRLRGGAIYYFRDGPTITWQGNTYEFFPCKLSGWEPVSGDQDNRPTFVMFNGLEEEENLFGPLAEQGYLDLATLYRRSVLQDNLLNDVNVYQQKLWLMSPKAATDRMIQFELRSPLDIPNFKTPFRIFSPPEFPVVSL